MVLCVLDFWAEAPSIFFTSLTCCRSLLLRQSRCVAPHVWATRGWRGNTGTCAVTVAARALDHVASPRPILASPRERKLRKRTVLLHKTPVRRMRPPSSEPLLLIIFLYRLQSTPWILCGSRFFLLTMETKPRHHTARKIRTTTLTTGLACHHWDWDLGLGFGVSWCEGWCWCFLGLGLWVWDMVKFNARGMGLICWRPRTLDLESCAGRNLVFKFLFWQIVDRTSPDIDMSKSQLLSYGMTQAV